MCNKMAFESKAHAKEYLREASQQGRGRGGSSKDIRKLKPYNCRFCDSWHLTSQRKLKNHKF